MHDRSVKSYYDVSIFKIKLLEEMIMHCLAYLKSMKVIFVLFFVASCALNPFFAWADISESPLQDNLMDHPLLIETGLEIENSALTDVEELLGQDLLSNLGMLNMMQDMNIMDPKGTAQMSMEALKQDADALLMVSAPQPPSENGYLPTAMIESPHPLILNYVNMPNTLIAVVMLIILGIIIRRTTSRREKYSRLTISSKDFQ
jgi:hypothetical protein